MGILFHSAVVITLPSISEGILDAQVCSGLNRLQENVDQMPEMKQERFFFNSSTNFSLVPA